MSRIALVYAQTKALLSMVDSSRLKPLVKTELCFRKHVVAAKELNTTHRDNKRQA